MLFFFFFYYYFSEKIRLGISCISPSRQMIRMKCQVLFTLNITNKKIKMSSVVISACRSKLWSRHCLLNVYIIVNAEHFG